MFELMPEYPGLCNNQIPNPSSEVNIPLAQIREFTFPSKSEDENIDTALMSPSKT